MRKLNFLIFAPLLLLAACGEEDHSTGPDDKTKYYFIGHKGSYIRSQLECPPGHIMLKDGAGYLYCIPGMEPKVKQP